MKDHLKEGENVLDIGSGSGYLTACLALMVILLKNFFIFNLISLKVGKTGKAIGIEHIPELANQSLVNIKKNHANLLDSGRIIISVGDGRLGYPEYAPFNAIHVGAAARTLPQAVCIEY